MPLKWVRGENPYRLNYFGILQVGAHANPRLIQSRKDDLERKLNAGREYHVGDRSITEADLTEAESRLLDPARWASEVVLVHPRPAVQDGKLPELCAAVEEAAVLEPSDRPLRLANLAALAPLVPPLDAADLPLPSWDEFPVPGPCSPDDIKADIQFDF